MSTNAQSVPNVDFGADNVAVHERKCRDGKDLGKQRVISKVPDSFVPRCEEFRGGARLT
jgi:hypothetical protein